METHVKERLIGAAVLVAIAIILIPELLSGPHESRVRRESAAADESAVKSYTVDLGKPTHIIAADVSTSTPAPPPEFVEAPKATPPVSDKSNAAPSKTEPSTPGPDARAANIPSSPPSTSKPGENPAPTRLTESTAEKSKPVPPSTSKPAPAAPSGTPTHASAAEHPAHAANGWAVQVGSYASEGMADRVAQRLKQQGFETFVMPFNTGGKTLYRVRIGPMKQRAAAESVAAKVKSSGSPAAVVPHP